jgi:shikimate kinase
VVDRVVLTGFMFSGKTTVGRTLADRLGWAFLDFDEEIERRTGRSVAALFRERGEPAFRQLEAELTEEVAGRRRVVLAPGGGWVTQPAAVARLRPGSLFVWLRVRPETVHARWRAGGGPERPLLAGPDPTARIAALLREREPLYARADLVCDADDDGPAAIAERIARHLGARPATRRP